MTSGLRPSLEGSSVCFGHQSVGEDVVRALRETPGFPLDVVATSDHRDFQRPIFGHFRVGRNGDPLSKCRAFATVIEQGVGNRVDIAFFKLCYVDITFNTDVEGVFQVYEKTMAALARTYPDVSFLHVTVPLRRVSGGPMAWLFSRTGWGSRERADQITRHAYNERIRAAYGETGRVFDLAALEATFPDETPSLVAWRGARLPSLVPEYTEDGGHLNPRAAAMVAERLTAVLDSVAAQREGARVV